MEMAAVQTGEIADFALDVSAAEAVLGGGLPAKAEQHLNLAGLAYQDDALAEQHLREAQSLAPERGDWRPTCRVIGTPSSQHLA